MTSSNSCCMRRGSFVFLWRFSSGKMLSYYKQVKGSTMSAWLKFETFKSLSRTPETIVCSNWLKPSSINRSSNFWSLEMLSRLSCLERQLTSFDCRFLFDDCLIGEWTTVCDFLNTEISSFYTFGSMTGVFSFSLDPETLACFESRLLLWSDRVSLGNIGLNSLELAIEMDLMSEQHWLHSEPHSCTSWLLSSARNTFFIT
jgi:hypothetical protein